MLAVSLCEHFGWTYEEYQNTPAPFIDLCLEKLKIDEQKRRQEEQRAKNRAPRRR